MQETANTSVRQFDIECFVRKQFAIGLKERGATLEEVDWNLLKQRINVAAVQERISYDLEKVKPSDWSQRVKQHERALRDLSRKVAHDYASREDDVTPSEFRFASVNGRPGVRIVYADGSSSEVMVTQFKCEFYPFCTDKRNSK